MVHSMRLADYDDWNPWPTETPLHADGLDDSRPHCGRTGAESDQLPAYFQANHDMTGVNPYVVPVQSCCADVLHLGNELKTTTATVVAQRLPPRTRPVIGGRQRRTLACKVPPRKTNDNWIVVGKWDMRPAQSQGEAGRTAHEMNCRTRRGRANVFLGIQNERRAHIGFAFIAQSPPCPAALRYFWCECQSLTLPDSTESAGQPYQVRLRQAIASNSIRYEVQTEHENLYDFDNSRHDPSLEYASIEFPDVPTANQYGAGPGEQSQPGFSHQVTSDTFRETALMTNAPLHSPLDPSFESILQTLYFNNLYYLLFPEPCATSPYVPQTDQAAELMSPLPSDDINLGLLQEEAVAALGNPQPLYHHGCFNQQGRKREVNARGRYECDVCGKDYKSTESLRNHQRKKHEERKAY